MSPEAATGQGTSAHGPRTGRFEAVACLVLAVLAASFYLWTALRPTYALVEKAKTPQSYYALQTAGFRSGHLYVALEPNPALLALPDPYDPVANAPYRVHDMSLYGGHYYLYFGVTPVILLFWPMAALAGVYPTEPFAVALFCFGAVWAGTALLFAVRRRFFPAAPAVALVAAVACLSFATPLIILVVADQFYQVPISCAVFLQALMLGAIYRSVCSERRRLAWLAAAGLLFGLSLGARPDYVLGFAALLVPLLAATRRLPAAERRKALIHDGAYAFGPVLVCGIALLIYNAQRFGSPSEFGMHYQLAGASFIGTSTLSLDYLGPHLFAYLLSPGHWQTYFPFFGAEAGGPFGVLRYIPWLWLSVFAFYPWRGGSAPGPSRITVLALSAASAAVANLLVISCFFFAPTPRYPCDFANAALILAGIGALALGQAATRRWARILASLVIIVLAAASLGYCAGVYFSVLPANDPLLQIGRVANWPLYAWERAHHVEFGGLRLEVELPEAHGDASEPLFETGPQPDRRDWLDISYVGANRAKLGFFHAGTGYLYSSEFTIPKDRRIVVETRCGSLFPPFWHPLFSTWTRDEFDRARSDLQVKVNGTEVLRAPFDCYESSPADLRIGSLGWPSGGVTETFSGRILGVSRLPLVKPPNLVPLFKEASPVEITLYLPAGKSNGADPILVTGHGDHSDLVYCVYDGLNRVKFALDHWGSGGAQSETVPYDPLVPHTVTLWMASMTGASSGRFLVVFDGRPLLNVEEAFYPGSPQSVVLGFNAFGASTAARQFMGRIVSFRQVRLDSLPPLVANGSYGAVEMSMTFPLGVMGSTQPLVVTGATGAGDFIYVKYIDATHLQVGFDHWAVGGTLGDPVQLDYSQPHRVAITLGSLYPPGSAGAWSKVVRVRIDGEIALDTTWSCYPSTPNQIKVGANPIGGSTCGALFTGKILSVERFPEPRE